MSKVIEGNLIHQQGKIAIVAGRFNSLIVDSLIKGAKDCLIRHGVSDSEIDLILVPGAFEIPLATQVLAKSKKYDGIIALGAVIRGGTPHFEYVAGECTKGLSTISLNENMPIAFGVLTVDSIEQAIERAGTKAGNKGSEAAISLLEMINLLRNIKSNI